MSDDFMDLLGDEGAKPQNQGSAGEGDPLSSLLGGQGGGLGDLLGSLMGGGGAAGASGGDMSDLLGSLMGGGGAAGASGDDMGDLLGSLMGGAPSGTSASQSAGAAGGLGDLLGGLMGGGGAGGLGGLLGGLMGGGSSPTTFGGGGGPSMPFASTLAEKLGISEQMASMLIMGAIGLLTSSLAKKRSSGRGGEVAFSEVTDADYIRSSGIASQLSSQMGISEDEAIHSLQQTMNLMAAGNSPEPQPKKPAKKTTAKKTTASSTQTKSKKKSSKKKPPSDFQDLLDDMSG